MKMPMHLREKDPLPRPLCSRQKGQPRQLEGAWDRRESKELFEIVQGVLHEHKWN